MNTYIVDYGSHCILGTKVKLAPIGKLYTVLTIGGPKGKFTSSIILQDAKGKEKQITWDRIVYIPTKNIGD